MNSIEYALLNTPPEADSVAHLSETLYYLVVRYEFDPGKTTRKSRKRILHAIVRTVIDATSDDDGEMENGVFAISVKKDIDKE